MKKSHENKENQKDIASHENKENQKMIASQDNEEAQDKLASHENIENHNSSASHHTKENHTSLAAQNILAEMGRLIAGSYYDHQEIRITEFNRIRDIIRRKLEDIPMVGGVEKKKKDEEKFQEHFVDKKIPEYLSILVKQDKLTTKEHEYILKVLDVQKNAEKYEKEYQKLMKEFVEMQPIYNKFLKHIRGISTVLSANLIKEFGYCERAQYISSLWKYCGMHVVEGEAPKRKRGQKLDFSIKRRTMVWKIGDSFVKQRTPFYRDIYDKEKERQLKLFEISQSKEENHQQIASQDNGENQEMVASQGQKENQGMAASQIDSETHKEIASQINSETQQTRASQEQKENSISLASHERDENQRHLANYPKNRMHCELRARRKMVKIFLAHYWECSKELTSQEFKDNQEKIASHKNKENLGKTAIQNKPYASARLGHKNISSWKEALLKNTQLKDAQKENIEVKGGKKKKK